MIKVENTKTHRKPDYITRNLIDYETMDVLVTDAKLVLVECKLDEAPNGLTNISKDKKNGIGCKPILISSTEKIEVGDFMYCNSVSGIQKVTDIDNFGLVNGFALAKKILALPEHFSPQQLQMIVDGKLKDGIRVLLECESTKGILQGGDIDDYPKRIKLNPHITIYPVEEKMYTAFQAEQYVTYRLKCLASKVINPLNFKEWFEQNVK